MKPEMTDEDFFMLRALDFFWKDGTLERLVWECEMEGRDWEKLRVAKHLVYRRMTVRVWLAENFRPVSNAMFNKKPIADVMELWKRTPRVPMAASKRPRSETKALLQGTRLGIEAWRAGWRAQTDWKTVK
jgi:hypothetical protein